MIPRGFKICTTIFGMLMLISSIVYYNRPNPYVRPELYFYLLTFSAGVIAFQIMYYGHLSKKLMTLIVVVEVLSIYFSYTLTEQALYQTVMGRDSWGHWAFTEYIVRHGHIPTSPNYPYVKQYAHMPNFHILICGGMLITSMQYKWASYMFVGVSTFIIEMLVIYVLSLMLFRDKKIALFSILFLGTADNVLSMTGTKYIVPNTLGVGIVILLLLLVISKEFNLKWALTVTILVTSLVFEHSISYGFLLIQLSVFLAVGYVYKRSLVSGVPFRESIHPFILLVLVLAVVEWVLFAATYTRDLLFIFENILRFRSIHTYEHKVAVPIKDVLLARLGMILFSVFSGFYGVRLLFKKRQNPKVVSFILLFGFFIGVGIVGVLTPAISQIAHRFWYYGEILGSVILAHLVVTVSKVKPLKVLTVLGIVMLVFLMLTASIVDDDNPLVPQYTVRTGWYNSEISGAYFIIGHINLPISSDVDYLGSMNRVSVMKGTPIRLDPNPPETFKDALNLKTSIFVIRKSLIIDRYFYLGRIWKNTPHIPLGNRTVKILSKLAVNKEVLYNNGNVIMYGG